jgi:hypothetical protein
MTNLNLAIQVLVVAAATMAQAEESAPMSAWFDHQPDRAWLEAYDPTLISRRLLTQFEFEDRLGGNSTAKWFWNARGAVPLTTELALGLQLELPMRWAENVGDPQFGLGDIEARLGIVQRLAPEWRWAVAMNAKFPTASSGSLGSGVFELRPILAMRWEASKRVELGINAEYTFTPRDEGTAWESELELKFPVTVELTPGLSAFLSYNQKWLYESDSVHRRLELSLTRFFGARKEHALSIGAEIPMTQENLNWKAALGYTWFMK